MILIENAQIMGLEPTIRGMRNPMNSWAKSDSGPCLTHGPAHCKDCPYTEESCHATEADFENNFIVGPNDLNLMLRLAKAGSVDGKFRRMIAVYVDITAPLYWWKEFDTYKVGTVANSCSTMHKIHAKEFSLEDFSHEHLLGEGCIPDHAYQNPHDILSLTVESLNFYRQKFLETGSEIKKCHFNELEKREELGKRQKQYWWQMIQLLPSSYNQKRTVMLNYEVLSNIYQHRRNHKPNKKIFGRLAPWKPIPLPTGPAFLQLPQPASPKALKPAPAPGDHHRETFEPIISRTIEMDKFTAEVILRYRDLDGEREIRTCPGDIYKIVNVFMDYARLLELVCDEWGLDAYHRAVNEVTADKLRSIAKKYQTAIGYDYDEAVAKCEAKKKRKPKDDDVGGDALELAMKRGKRSPKKKEK